MHACELDGAWGGNLLFEVFEYGGLHLVVIKVVPVSGGANKTKKSSCAIWYLSEGLRRVWSLVLLVCLYIYTL